MKELFNTKLTTMELYVLASVLGHDFVVGISKDVLDKNISNIDSKINDSINYLQERNLIDYGISGDMAINKHLITVINCITNPDKVVIVSGNTTSATYYFTKEASSCLNRIKDTDIYEISLYEAYSSDDLFVDLNSQHIEDKTSIASESLSTADLSRIKELYSNFREDEAFELIKDIVTNKDVSNDVFGFISGKCARTYIKFYELNNCILRDTGNVFYVKNTNHRIKGQISEEEISFQIFG